MSTADTSLNELTRRLIRPESVDDVLAVLATLDELSNEPDPQKTVASLKERAFRCLRELTEADLGQASSLLITNLLPRCLRVDRQGDGQTQPRYDTLFGDWLASLPDENRHPIRQQAIAQAIRALNGDGLRNALRVIGSVGYWDDEILRALDSLIKSRDDETGDHALAVRVWLMPTIEGEPWLLTNLHRRIERGMNLHSQAAARAIGNAETVDLVWRQFLSPKLASSGNSGFDMFIHLAMNLLVRIATRCQDDILFERVWEYISQIARAQPDSAKAFLGLDSRVASSLNTGRAIYDLLHRAAAASGHHRYIFFLRLRECAQPLHLRAWDDIPFGTELDAVKSEATQTTGMTGQFRTVELERKEVAWDILLCRGVPSLLPPFADALSGEQSGYVLSGFLDLASCLALKPIPQEVREFLAGTPSRQDWPTNERLVAQIGAIHAAHGASNAEAFEALLGYRQVGPGVLYSLVEALAESAATEVRAGDRSIVGRLLDAAERADREDTRGAAAGAISDLLEWRLLTREEVARIPKVLESPTTDRHGRRELLFSLACCPPDEVPAAVLDRARIMLDEASAVQEGTVHAALTVIARQPKSRSDFDFLTRRLGLEESDGTFVAGEKTREGVVPHVVGRFFVAEPDRFGAAVTSLIENGDASALSYLLPSIRELGPRNPIGVVDALLARLRQADEGSVADLPLLHLLAEIAPNRLLTACAGVDAWLPQARSELANTLGRLLELSAASADLRFHLLIKLTGDGIYAVRRAAYRAAARCDPERLAKLIESWADWREVGREGPRRRAAECAAWLFDISGSINSLRGDQEPGVRDAFERSMLEREERDRASNYEKHVLSVSNPDGIIAAWRYGVALSQVGDDSTIYILAERGRQGLPAAVRFWLARVRKAVERRWNDVTTKWPEPWYARPGLLETFEGTIRAKDQVVTVSGTLWQMQGGQPGSFNSWGGWAAASNMLTGGQELLIPGRRAAKIIIGTSHWPDGNVVFSGNGPYPDKNL